jgi:hypothetical protein
MSTLHDFGGVLGRPLDAFFWALTNLMVAALGSCVKWPLMSALHIKGEVGQLEKLTI